jgi:cytochrome c
MFAAVMAVKHQEKNWMERARNALVCLILLASVSFGQEKHAGKELFQERCGGCHSLDADKVGPRLRGVYGKPAGTNPTFKYSAAAKDSHVTWDEVTLNKWLTDPESVIPDNDMSFRLESSQERTAIIEYLKRLSKSER